MKSNKVCATNISTAQGDMEYIIMRDQVNELLDDVNEWVANNSNWLTNGTKSKIKEAT